MRPARTQRGPDLANQRRLAALDAANGRKYSLQGIQKRS